MKKFMQVALLMLVTTWAVAAPAVSQAVTISGIANRLVIAGVILGNSKANSGPLSAIIGPLADALFTTGCQLGPTGNASYYCP